MSNLSQGQVIEYVQKQASELLYNKAPSILPSISERRQERFFTRGQRTNLTPGSTIEFEIVHDQLADLCSASLSINLNITGAGAVSNIVDIIDRVEVFYNEANVERTTEVGAWANTFLSFSAHKDFVDSEGSSLLGLVNKYSTYNQDGSQSGSRTYNIPMALISPFFNLPNYLPLLSNRLRVNILLQNNLNIALSKYDATATYTVANVSLLMDTIIVTKEYRDKIIQAMQTPTGFILPYTSWTTGKLSVVASTNHQLQISNVHTNALSLHLLYDNQQEKQASVTAGQWIMYNQSFALPNFQNLYVRSGSKIFTPPDRINGFTELYIQQEKCLNSLCNLGVSSGWIGYNDYTGTYTRDTTDSTTMPSMPFLKGKYPICLISANLEKSLTSDYDVINSGLNSGDGATNYFNIEINTSSALNASDNWLYAIVHKRLLIFANSGVDVEY